MGARRNPRGTKLGTHKDKTRLRLVQKETDPRRKAAKEEAQRAERELNARLVTERREAEELVTQEVRRLQNERIVQTELDRLARIKEARRADEQAALKRKVWTMGQARSLVRQGYTVEHAMRLTGYPRVDLEDADHIFD